jgi:spore coat protein H
MRTFLRAVCIAGLGVISARGQEPAALPEAALTPPPAAPPAAATQPAAAELPRSADELFQTTKVWTVHLRFTLEEWTAMEPAGGGPPRPPAGGFGPAMLLAPGFLKHGDADANGAFSADEFRALGEKWFGEWDKAMDGELTSEELRNGLNAAIPMPTGPPRGGGRPGASMLQGAEGKRNGLASAMGIEFKSVHADVEFEGRTFSDVSVRYKGNGTFMESRGTLKRSLKVDLNKHVKGQKLAGVTTLNLHNCITDAAWMNEVLSYRLYRDAGVPAPRTAYARVFVTVPGKHEKHYFGLYSLVEDLGNAFIEENFGSKKGALFKPVTPQLFSDLGGEWAKYQQSYDPKGEVSTKETQRVIDFARLVSHADDAEFARRVPEFLELESFARYMAATVWLSTLDSLLAVGQNYYLYLHPKTGRFQFVPWDLDHSFGQFPLMGTQEQRENLNIMRPWRGENRFLERVFAVEAFQRLYRDRLAVLNNGLARPERLAQQVDEIAAAIRSSIQEESATKLANFDKAVAGEATTQTGNMPGPGAFSAPRKPIKTFAIARHQSVTDQLSGKAEGQALAGFGFGPPGGPGGGGPPRGFGPGMFFGNTIVSAMDADKNGRIAREEMQNGFTKWFADWNSDQSGVLNDEQLRAGINKDFAPRRPEGAPRIFEQPQSIRTER